MRRPPDHPLAPALTSAVAVVAFLVIRLEVVGHGRIARFIMLERPFADVHRVPRGIPVLADNGYDGQFFYRLALDPADLRRSAFGIRLDTVFRLQRIGYPFLAWALSLGRHSWVPVTLVVVNVVAISVLGGLGGMAAREAGRHAMCGLLLPAYFGFVFSVARDIAEPTAAAFLIGGVLALRRDRPLVAGLLLAASVLTRETALVAVGLVLVFRVVAVVAGRARPGARDLAWLLPVVAFAAWQVRVHAVVGKYPILVDGSDNSANPFLPLIRAVHSHVRTAVSGNADATIWVLEMIALTFVIVSALRVVVATDVPVLERAIFVAYIVELFFLSPRIWNGTVDLRSLDEVYLFAVLGLIGTPRMSLRHAAVVVTPVTAIVAAHRIVSL